MRQLPHLTLNNGAGFFLNGASAFVKLKHFHGVEDRCQGVTKFVTQHCQELVLAAIRLLECLQEGVQFFMVTLCREVGYQEADRRSGVWRKGVEGEKHGDQRAVGMLHKTLALTETGAALLQQTFVQDLGVVWDKVAKGDAHQSLQWSAYQLAKAAVAVGDGTGVAERDRALLHFLHQQAVGTVCGLKCVDPCPVRLLHHKRVHGTALNRADRLLGLFEA